jgi:hypothetical protein
MANTSRTVKVKFDGDSSGLVAASAVGGKTLSGWRDRLAKVSKSFKGTSDASGAAVEKVNTNLDKVNEHIKTVHERLAGLTQKFAETGDIKLFANMSRDKTLLSKLQAVRKEIEQTNEAARKHSDSLSKGMSGGFLAGAKKMLKSAAALGTNIATSMVEKIPGAFGGALSALPPQAQVVIVGGIVAAIVAGSALIGAAVSGAILAGLSAVTIGAGVALAFRDPRIKAAGGDLGKTVMAGLEDAASVFINPVLRSINIVKDGWRSLAPDIKKAFAQAAPYLDNLTRGLVALVQRMMPGLLSALGKAGPILSMIGDELGNLGTAFGQFFKDLGSNANGARVGLQFLFKLIEGTVVFSGKLLSFLAGTFEKVKLLAALMAGDIPTAVDILLGKQGKLKEKTDETGTAFQRLTEAQQREITALGSGSVALQGFRDRTEILNSSMLGAIEKAGSLAAALDLLNGKTLGAREASRNYQAAIDAVSASLKTNGKSLDEHTPKGRNNLATLDALARAATANAAAIYEQTAQTGNTALAQEKATAAYNKGRDELIKGYLQFDNNIGRAKAYADAVMGIPPTWSTKPSFNDGAATAAIKGFEKKINTLDGRTITVYARFTPKGDLYIPGQGTQLKDRWGGINYAMARGGMLQAHYAKSPSVLYGERETGGEAFIPRKGNLARSRRTAETVVRDWLGGEVSWGKQQAPSQSSSATSASDAGGDTYVYVTIDGQQLEGRIDRVVRESNRGLKRRAQAGSGAAR